ncbi:hypothetical protein [Halomonas salipaludis]|uniref:DUF2513 domain-containing protein n=1 Tax=Halomonas salipaludis TaxID=2032625 RepID=A0A2A2ETT5_9GAMM|nr:hypothetical protein [Halomonas salipaludis]PAU76546.1 hypothetical protein CK498_11120 [Halomonas salipaludis]
MLDTAYLKQLLELVGDKGYLGIDNGDLMNHLAPDEGQPVEFTEMGQQFKYHMDEAWMAGLIRDRDDVTAKDWGLVVGVSGHWAYRGKQLVLSPIGGELLEELGKPKGLERLKQAVRSAGAAAGTEALRAGVAELLKGAIF